MRRLPLLALGAAMVCAAALILWLGREQALFADEWTYLILRRGWDPGTLLRPQVGHLTLFPILVYKVYFGVFGADRFLPLRLLAVALQLLVAGLLFACLRRRVGDLLALPGVILFLFLGSAHEVLMGTFTINILIGMAAGLGMLLCLDRGDRRGDIAASLLLTLSLASFSIGVVFAAGAAVLLWAGRAGWASRVWIVAAPVSLYAAWAVWATKFDQPGIDASNIGPTPTSVADSAAALCAAIFGVFRTPGAVLPGQLDLEIHPELGIPIAVALGAVVVVRARRPGVATTRFWAMLAMLLLYWVLIGLTHYSQRQPNDSRFIYPGAILLFLLAAELVRGIRVGRGSAIAIAAVLAVSLAANVAALDDGGQFFRIEAQKNRSQLAALELAGDHVDPGLVVEDGSINAAGQDMSFEMGDYRAATAEFGSPAYSLRQLAEAPPDSRDLADAQLDRAYGLEARPTAHAPAGHAGGRVRADGAQAGSVSGEGRCVRFVPSSKGEPFLSLTLPPGGFRYTAPPHAEIEISLKRFGSGFTAHVPADFGSAAVKIPTDRSSRPWRALLGSTTPLRVCPY